MGELTLTRKYVELPPTPPDSEASPTSTEHHVPTFTEIKAHYNHKQLQMEHDKEVGKLREEMKVERARICEQHAHELEQAKHVAAEEARKELQQEIEWLRVAHRQEIVDVKQANAEEHARLLAEKERLSVNHHRQLEEERQSVYERLADVKDDYRQQFLDAEKNYHTAVVQARHQAELETRQELTHDLKQLQGENAKLKSEIGTQSESLRKAQSDRNFLFYQLHAFAQRFTKLCGSHVKLESEVKHIHGKYKGLSAAYNAKIRECYILKDQLTKAKADRYQNLGPLRDNARCLKDERESHDRTKAELAHVKYQLSNFISLLKAQFKRRGDAEDKLATTKAALEKKERQRLNASKKFSEAKRELCSKKREFQLTMDNFDVQLEQREVQVAQMEKQLAYYPVPAVFDKICDNAKWAVDNVCFVNDVKETLAEHNHDLKLRAEYLEQITNLHTLPDIHVQHAEILRKNCDLQEKLGRSETLNSSSQLAVAAKDKELAFLARELKRVVDLQQEQVPEILRLRCELERAKGVEYYQILAEQRQRIHWRGKDDEDEVTQTDTLHGDKRGGKKVEITQVEEGQNWTEFIKQWQPRDFEQATCGGERANIDAEDRITILMDDEELFHKRSPQNAFQREMVNERLEWMKTNKFECQIPSL